MLPALFQLLEVCKIPFQKEKSSDESKQVPNLPVFFNALCPYLHYDIKVEEDDDISIA